MTFDLTGRVALITGAGSPTGIGTATARLLAELGAAVVLAATSQRAHDRAAELTADGHRALGVIADLTDPAAADGVVADTLAHFGRLDMVVNNAGMTSVSVSGSAESGDALGITPDAWRASLARNLDSAFYVTRAALPHLRAQQWGRVVCVTSVTGPVMAMRGESAYAASKAGMVGLMRSIAVDYGADGITANAVAPGWIQTGSQTEHEYAQGLRTPVGRSALPSEVASAVAWLCTPGAASITGQCLVIDGGNSIAEERA